METNYTVDYFEGKFKSIPSKMWRSTGWGSIDRKEPTCATGHCGFDNGRYDKATKENIALIKIFESLNVHDKDDGTPIVDDSHRFSWKVVRINDGQVKEYRQSTPKKRVLAALRDITKMQEPKHIDITKELAVLPIQETSDVIATKETILS